MRKAKKDAIRFAAAAIGYTPVETKAIADFVQLLFFGDRERQESKDLAVALEPETHKLAIAFMSPPEVRSDDAKG